MPQPGISLRWSLLRGLLLLILLLAGSILTVTVLGAQDTVQEVLRRFTRAVAERTEARVRGFLGSIEAELRTLGRWADAGLLDCHDPACLASLVRPVLERIPHVDSVNTANDRGAGTMLLRTENGWRTRQVDVEAWGAEARWTDYDLEGDVLKRWTEELGYDPRARPWFVASRGEGVAWTDPYQFFTTKRPGVTASLRVPGPGTEDLVLAFDVLLDELSRFTTGMDVSPHGFAVVVDGSGRVVGLPRAPAFGDSGARAKALLTRVDELGLPAVRDLAQTGRARGEAALEAFEFASGGEPWWGEWREIRLGDAPSWYVGIAMPLDDFLGPARRNRALIAGLLAVALAAAGLLALGLARRYAKPLESLTAMSERLRRLDTSPAPPPRTKVREITGLYDAQERMRQALDSFARYVPTEVVRELLEKGEAARIGGREVVITVLFTDIRGFTTISEQLAPTELVAHMSRYFGAMIDTLRAGGATIDKLMGDAIVAFWGAPRADPEHARHGVEAVSACRAKLDQLNATWREAGLPELPTRFGMATGPVVVGNVGAPSRLHYTALGDTMNLAARLEAANERYGTTVLAAASTVEAAGDGWRWRAVDRVAVKGRIAETEIFTLEPPPEST